MTMPEDQGPDPQRWPEIERVFRDAEDLDRRMAEADHVERLLNVAADEALATGTWVDVGRLRVVPDVLLLELAVNGCGRPRPYRIERGEGRHVEVFLNVEQDSGSHRETGEAEQ